MSRQNGSGHALFAGLIDDAAVFPPGSATLVHALDVHRTLRQSAAADYVGPLLVPAAAVPALIELVGDPDQTLTIGVIGTAGDEAGLLRAVALADGSALSISGVEIALGSSVVGELLRALDALLRQDIPLAVEVSRAGSASLTALGAHRSLVTSGLLRGKYRTGGVQPDAVPSADALAAVIRTAVDAELPMKFTAGLHHAVRTTDQHGVLNVMSAVHDAITGGWPASRLELGDPVELTGEVTTWTEQQVAEIRSVFTGFGCCGVLEPLIEAGRLGVLPPIAHEETTAVADR
ncbi:MAG: hypothetical protein M3Y77_13210 [Actinomycetota bacterium]|nr:hypothetical protein [Actinomycetota bacterium]